MAIKSRKLRVETINRVQRMILNLMKVSQYNAFDGNQVVVDLVKYRDKWMACVWGRFVYWPLIPLRDLPEGFYNADTLFLSTQKSNITFIETIARAWQADEVGWYCNGKLHGVVDTILEGLAADAAAETNKLPLFFRHPLGASPESGVAYFRIWWD